MDRIAVLIPCYNEGATIGKAISDFRAALPDAKIYVYDNDSSDDTVEKAKAAGAIVRHEYQKGKGNVVRRMFREIDAECYVLVDGDDTYPAESAPEMVRCVFEHQADMVVGDRLSSTYFSENKRLFHNFGNTLVKASINSLFNSSITDIMTGYRAFSYLFVKTFPALSHGFEIETEMSIHAIDKSMQIDNVIVQYRDRPDGSESKLDTYKDGFKIMWTVFRLYKNYRPQQFFGTIALILAFISVCFLAPVLETYLITGLVPRFPTLIACGFTFVAAVQAEFTGLILNVIRQKNQQDFEMELIRTHNELHKLLEEE